MSNSKSKNYSKKKGNNRKGKNSFNTKEQTQKPTSMFKDDSYGGNDVSWYTHFADLSESASRIPFAWQPGRRIPMRVNAYDPDSEEPNAIIEKNYIYPGIMTLTFHPTVGFSDDITSPINVAAREVYAKIRSKYSGSLEADAPDIMMYLIALDSLYMVYEEMKRAYYLVGQYTPNNNLFPKAMLKALGYDFDDLLTNKVKLFQYICQAGAMLTKFLVPDTMDLYKRHQFMVSNIYCDSPVLKSQQYAFRLGSYYRLSNWMTTTELDQAIWAEDGHFRTVEQMWRYFNEAITNLMSWDTAYTIVGYLQRAYEGVSFLAPTPVIEGGVLSPVYNLEILTQIQNASAVPVSIDSLKVTQDVVNQNMLVSKPSVDDAYISGYNEYWQVMPIDPILSLPTSSQPSSAEIIIGTRLTTAKANVDPEDRTITCGTEIISSIDTWTDPEGISNGHPHVTHFILNTDESEYEETLKNILWYTCVLEAFNMHPHIVTSIYNADTDSTSTLMSINADNVTVINNEHMHNLHRMCIYSEFNCFGDI